MKQKTEILWGNEFIGKDKETFLQNMSSLWDKFEEEGLNDIIGFECMVDNPIKIIKLLRT